MAAVPIVSAIHTFYSYVVDLQGPEEELRLLSLLGVFIAAVSIAAIGRTVAANHEFISQKSKETPAKNSAAMLDTLRKSFLSIPLSIVGWVIIIIYLVANDAPVPYYWVISIPTLLIFFTGLIFLLGLLRANFYDLSFTEYRKIGKEQLIRDKKTKEKKRQAEQKKKNAVKKKQTLFATNKPTKVMKPSFSTSHTPSQLDRLNQLTQIVRRTKEMRLTDLKSLLSFKDKPSLMKWLYSLPDAWIFTVEKDSIVFETADDDKKIPKTKTTEAIKKPEQKKQCLYCEADLVDVEDEGPIVCLNCGKKAPYCEVCKNIITAGEKITQVKSCNHVFHKNHILEWIKIKGTCPICKNQINEESLQPYISM